MTIEETVCHLRSMAESNSELAPFLLHAANLLEATDIYLPSSPMLDETFTPISDRSVTAFAKVWNGVKTRSGNTDEGKSQELEQ